MNLPSVSVIIPTCDRPVLFRKALESVLAQDYENIKEIIVTDDGSGGETRKIAGKFQKENGKIIYSRNSKYKKGPNGNKQNGLDLATGDFIATLDDDDLLVPEAVSALVGKYLESGGKYRTVLANCRRSDNGKLTGKHRGMDEEITYKDLLCGKFAGEYFGINSRDFFDGLKLEDDLGGMEGLTWLKLWKEKNRVGLYVHKVLRIYGVYPGQFSNAYEKDPERTFLGYRKHLETFGEELLGLCPEKYAYLSRIAAYFAKLSGRYAEAAGYAVRAFKAERAGPVSLLFVLFILLPMPARLASFIKKTCAGAGNKR